MNKNFDRRLTQLEAAAAPVDPPTLQIIWPDHAGPVIPMPGANWAGPVIVRVLYDDEGDGYEQKL